MSICLKDITIENYFDVLNLKFNQTKGILLHPIPLV